MLAEVVCILYDEMRAITPVPRLTHFDKAEDQWFFSLSADTLDFLFLQFLTRTKEEQLLQDGLSGGRGTNMPVILFRSGEERQSFKEELEHNPVTVEARHDVVSFIQNDPMITEQDRKIIAFSNAVIERFREWRARDS